MFKNPYTSQSAINNLQTNLSMSHTNNNILETDPIFVKNDTNNTNCTLKNLEIIKIIKTWNFKYNGTDDAFEFIESIEELSDVNKIPLNDLTQVMAELLSDKAQNWWKNSQKSWKDWNDFKTDFLNYFLTPLYFEKLEEDIRKYTQRPKEPFRSYALSLKNLMRHTKLNEVEKLERIFRNAQPDYQTYIINKDFSSFDELLSFTDDIESKRNLSKKLYTQANTSNSFQTNCNGKRIHELSVDINNEEPPNKKISLNKTTLIYDKSQIMATILLEYKLVTSPIDTSSQRNFIGTQFLNQLFCKPTYVKENGSADGSTKSNTTGVQLNVTFGKTTNKCTFYLMPDFKENIKLGLEFLLTFNATISCAGLHCSLKNTSQELCKDIDVNTRSQIKAPLKLDEFPPKQGITEHNVSSDLSNEYSETDIPDCLQDIISEAMQRRTPSKRMKFLRTVNDISYRIIIAKSGIVKVKKLGYSNSQKQEEVPNE